MAYDLCWLGNAFKLLSGFSGTKLPKKHQGNRRADGDDLHERSFHLLRCLCK